MDLRMNSRNHFKNELTEQGCRVYLQDRTAGVAAAAGEGHGGRRKRPLIAVDFHPAALALLVPPHEVRAGWREFVYGSKAVITQGTDSRDLSLCIRYVPCAVLRLNSRRTSGVIPCDVRFLSVCSSSGVRRAGATGARHAGELAVRAAARAATRAASSAPPAAEVLLEATPSPHKSGKTRTQGGCRSC